jgi:multidrug efflux pump subunit AcrB
MELWGVQDKVVYIDASEKQLTERGITAENFMATLGRQNMVVDAGYVDAQQRRHCFGCPSWPCPWACE